MDRLENIFNIKIDNYDLFKCALTHPSYTKENNLPYDENYERLEFLGDAVLKLVASDILFSIYPDYTEGNLSKIRSIVVSDNILSQIAHDIGLCDLIILANHEKKQGLANLESVCACAFEAVLGAYYLDNKFEYLIPFLRKILMPYIEDVDKNFEKFNSKALLQEYTQSLSKELPSYEVVAEKGKAHNKTFYIAVSYNGNILAQAEGKTKKQAQQEAAYNACVKLGLIKGEQKTNE